MTLTAPHSLRGIPSMLLTALLGATSACGGEAPAESPSLNRCTEARFVDRTASVADRSVTFGSGARAFEYTPPCLTIAAGQTVTFLGDLNAHPLAPGSSPSALDVGTAGNPITRIAAGTMTRVTFPRAGVFPYFCEYHYAGGMVGVVRVR